MPVDLENRLAMPRPTVVTVCMFASSELRDLNSAHFRGTPVPLEEPSTASQADSCTQQTEALFDHLVGAGEQRGRWNQCAVIGFSK